MCLIATAAWTHDEDWRKRKAGDSAPGKAPQAKAVESRQMELTPETITFELPPKLALPSIPQKPLDEQLRVALILPIDETDQRSRWSYRLYLNKNYKPVHVNHAAPVAAVLPTVLAKLFPRVKVVEKAPDGANDVLSAGRVARRGGLDRDGQNDVDEIYKYVSLNVTEKTNGSQQPMKKASSQSGIVVLGKASVRAQE